MSELLCKVLFIDLDDTIWDFKANSVLSLRQVYDEFALKKEIPDYDRFKSLYMATNHELWELYHHNRITKDYLIVERFSRPLRHAGSKMSEDKEFIMALNDRYLDVLSQQNTLVPGAVELLDYLTTIPLLLGLLIGAKVFKFRPAINLGCCAGARTTTAALGAIQESLGSTLPAMGYTVTYAIGNTLLILGGVVLVLLSA